MSIKPILFSTPMVQAIMDGRKTMTRRVMNPTINHGDKPHSNLVTAVVNVNYKGPCVNFYDEKGFYAGADQFRYQPGDILWVRETWTRLYYADENGYTHFDQPMIFYASDGVPDIALVDGDGFEEDDQRIKWRPSIFMPKEACRLFLRVTDVRAERLQEISLEDIEREGLYCDPPYTKDHPAYSGGMRIHWIRLWDHLNAKRGYGWDKNPWVWVYTFERIDKPEGWATV